MAGRLSRLVLRRRWVEVFPGGAHDDPDLTPQAGLTEMGLPLPTIVISPRRQQHGPLLPSQGVPERRT
ncbi:MAG: hypothetical protein WCF33_02500 [Pseudonocardiaceae bacterium]